MARLDEIFASSIGVVQPVHYLTRRDVVLYKRERRLTSLQWKQATNIEVRFRGHKGDEAQQGSVVMRTRDDASGTRSGVGAGGGVVALMVELLSVYPTLPESAPCRRIGAGTRLECGYTRRPSRHITRWRRRQKVIQAKSGSTHYVSVQPIRWWPEGRCHSG